VFYFIVKGRLFPLPRDQASSPEQNSQASEPLRDSSLPAGCNGRAPREFLGAKPQKLNNTINVNVNSEWKCNKRWNHWLLHVNNLHIQPVHQIWSLCDHQLRRCIRQRKM